MQLLLSYGKANYISILWRAFSNFRCTFFSLTSCSKKHYLINEIKKIFELNGNKLSFTSAKLSLLDTAFRFIL